MTDKQYCTGCSACMAACPFQAISMKPDAEGFLYPEINTQLCRNCGICEKVCPVGKKDGIRQDRKDAYVVFSREESIREASSSGGLFSMMAYSILEKKGTVFGCAMSEDCYSAHHISATEAAELIPLRGSKYVQSDTETTFQQVRRLLDEGQWVLYSGTPCQIAGLRYFLGNAAYNRLLTVDVICHGAPSPLVWQQYAKELEEQYGSKIRRVSFRNKTEGWRRYSLYCEFENGTHYRKTLLDDLYLRGFIENLYLRPACQHCSAKGDGYWSDLTIGDCWSGAVAKPEIRNIEGVSIAVAHTEQGARFLQGLTDGYIAKEDFEIAMKGNPSYFEPISHSMYRPRVLGKIIKHGAHKTLYQYCGKSFPAKLRRKVATYYQKSKKMKSSR